MIVFYRYHLATRICPFFPVFSMGSEQRQNLYIGIIANFPLMEGRAGEPSSHAPNGGNDSPFKPMFLSKGNPNRCWDTIASSLPLQSSSDKEHWLWAVRSSGAKKNRLVPQKRRRVGGQAHREEPIRGESARAHSPASPGLMSVDPGVGRYIAPSPCSSR